VHRRGHVFAVVTAFCLLLGGGWVLVAALQADSTTSSARVGVPERERSQPGGRAPVAVRGDLLVRAVDPYPRQNGHVERARLGAHPRTAPVGRLACQRMHMAGGHGLCLAAGRSGIEYRVLFFDRDFRVRHELPLDGLPSRVRVSRSGRYGAYTSFVTGDSYAAGDQFSTRTVILEMRSGRQLAELEQFEVLRDGRRIDSPDFNFWGVTFASGDDRFYATLATGGERYLVRGSLRARRVELLRENVECPSLSPDGTRLAYKRSVGGPEDWRLHVLDLRTMRDVPLAERRSIDDQVEWLNDRTVVYGDGRDVWAARADGRGRPRRVLLRADSPARLGPEAQIRTTSEVRRRPAR
jgi:hypothetical protein